MTARIWRWSLAATVMPVQPEAQGVLDLGGGGSGKARGAGAHPRVGGQPVDVVPGEPGVIHGRQTGVDGQVEVAAIEAASDRRLADPRDDSPALQRLLDGRAHRSRHRPEERELDVVVVLEHHLHRHAGRGPRRARRRPGWW